jgi:hypothetical protein
MARMSTKDDKSRDWLTLLPRDAWPEPWRSMDAGTPPPRPNNVEDPEQSEPVAVLVPIHDPYGPVLAHIASDLRAVRDTWEAKKAPKPRDRQVAVWSSIKIVSDYLETVLPDGHELATHLVAMRTALVNLQAGRGVDWLAPAVIGGRAAGVNIEIGAWRGRYASIVELLHREGRPVRGAARDVKSKIPDTSLVWGSGAPSWEGVKRWRDYDVKVENSAEKAGFEAGLALAKSLPKLSAMELLKHMSKVGV